GRGQRMAEVDFLVKFFEANQKWPVVVAGDLNGIIAGADTEPELQPLIDVGLVDVLEWQQTPVEQRATYIYFGHGHKRVPMQLDYILVPRSSADQICQRGSAKVVDTFYLSEGSHGALTAPDQRRELVSDHFPLEVVFLLKD